jgi:hypothetical protein
MASLAYDVMNAELTRLINWLFKFVSPLRGKQPAEVLATMKGQIKYPLLTN